MKVEDFELIIQVNGKVRGKIKVDKNIDQMEIEKIALNVENVKNYISSSKVKKAIYIKDRLINFVI